MIAGRGVAELKGEDVITIHLYQGGAMAGGFFLRHSAARVLFLHHRGAGDAAVNDHFAAMNGGAAGQREGVGDIERFARVLLEDLVHLDRDKFAGDAEAGLDVDERQGDAGRG